MYGLRERQEMSRNFFDTTVRAVSLPTLFRERGGPMVVQNASLTRLWDF